MTDWNVLVTYLPGRGNWPRLRGALSRFGHFWATPFRGVCLGRVEDARAFLEALREALEAKAPWTRALARAIPVERSFSFSAESLGAQLCEAVAGFGTRIEGSFYVRLERRGLPGAVDSPAIERAVADHLYDVAAGRGVTLRTDFEDPDWLVIAETVGNACGVALVPRAMRERYPFAQPR